MDWKPSKFIKKFIAIGRGYESWRRLRWDKQGRIEAGKLALF